MKSIARVRRARSAGSFDAAFVSQVLLRQMDYSLIRAEVANRHVSINDACKLQARNDALQNLGQRDATAGQAFGTWLQGARSNARIDVDTRYGTFDPAKFQINPPPIDQSNGSSSSASSSSQNP